MRDGNVRMVLVQLAKTWRIGSNDFSPLVPSFHARRRRSSRQPAGRSLFALDITRPLAANWSAMHRPLDSRDQQEGSSNLLWYDSSPDQRRTFSACWSAVRFVS